MGKVSEVNIDVGEAIEILNAIKELKILLVKAQDFENSALMRDMEGEYLNKKTK